MLFLLAMFLLNDGEPAHLPPPTPEVVGYATWGPITIDETWEAAMANGRKPMPDFATIDADDLPPPIVQLAALLRVAF